MIAFIPARAGSKRIPGKAMKILGGKPLLQWTIEAAIESKVFEHIVLTVDSQEICVYFGMMFPEIITINRPEYFARDNSPDIEWIRHAEWFLRDKKVINFEEYAILRPTSPFRDSGIIRAAVEFWEKKKQNNCSSMRSVCLAKEHPAKMWVLDDTLDGYRATRYIDKIIGGSRGTGHDWCDLPTQNLAPVYVQNGAIYIARAGNLKQGVIAGDKVLPFVLEGDAGLDLNTRGDWLIAEEIVKEREGGTDGTK